MTRDNQQEHQKKIEQIILIIYSLYTIIMAMVSLLFSWEQWMPAIIVCGMLFCWWVHLKKYRDYRFRAFLTTSLAWLNFVLYGVHAESYFDLLATMSGMIILLGIYCIPETVYLSLGGSTFLLFYHGVVLKNIDILGQDDVFRTILKILSIYLVEYITYYLIKTQLNSNRRLMETMEALNMVERSKEDFMANVSHEIRTPINTVCGMSEMLLREELEPAVRGEVFDIQTAGRNLLSIVSDILDFSELESGKMDLVEEPYNITSTLNDVMNMTNAQLNGKKLELIVSCDANIPSAMVGDEQKLRRVIMNIVGNAVKFTQEGCITITLSARKEEYGVNLVVNVKDTGIGMNEVELEKLFSSFNQVDTKRNRQEGGVGLGLAISQAIVRKMGGFITVKSTPGIGSEFQFVVPQKVVDNTAIISLENPDAVNVVSYINMEKYTYAAIRDGYEECIRHMVEQLGFRFKQCRNLAELKRRLENTKYSHVFICWEEYCEDKEWFDQLAEQTPVVLVLDREHDEEVSGRFLRIYKPFYAVAMAAVLNGEQVIQSVSQSGRSGSRFIAPTSNILVVDDNMMNVKVVEGLLRPYQIKVFAAYSGKEALQKIESMDFDFVFMDHMMPEMDGVETMHRIRQKPGKYFQIVPIIALTANAIGGAREMFLAEGFQDFVAKPIELSVLERVLLRYIPPQKITKVSAEEAAKLAAKQGGNKALRSAAEDAVAFEGINVKQGIAYCGGKLEDYLEVVQIYYTTGLDKKIDIQKFFEQKDWKNYSILVHAVKSTSQGIGASELSDMAKELERAGKSADEGYINSHHREMMEEYARVLEVLGADTRINPEAGKSAPAETAGDPSGNSPDAEASAEDSHKAEELPEMTGEELEGILGEIQEALGTFESEAVEEILKKLQGYRYGDQPLAELVEPIRKKASMFDFMGAEDELTGIRERLG
ncbi:MAG: response regulator [Acetatifactor sp.]|nr:response regulator [Acetatifactor sp.]